MKLNKPQSKPSVIISANTENKTNTILSKPSKIFARPMSPTPQRVNISTPQMEKIEEVEISNNLEIILDEYSHNLKKYGLRIENSFYSNNGYLYMKTIDELGSYIYIADYNDKIITDIKVDLSVIEDIDEEYIPELLIINKEKYFNIFVDDSEGVIIIDVDKMITMGDGYINHNYIPCEKFESLHNLSRLSVDLVQFYRDSHKFLSEKYESAADNIIDTLEYIGNMSVLRKRYMDKLSKDNLYIEKKIIKYFSVDEHTFDERNFYEDIRYNKSVRLDMMYESVKRRRQLDNIFNNLNDIKEILENLSSDIIEESSKYGMIIERK